VEVLTGAFCGVGVSVREGERYKEGGGVVVVGAKDIEDS